MTTLSNGVQPATGAGGPSVGLLQRPDHQTVQVHTSLDGPLLESAWQLYEDAFRELNTMTVQRHLMYRPEFDDLMSDERQGKYLAFNTDGDLIGLSVYTNQLDAVHLISPEYFECHWPAHYASRRVWWVSFVAVAQEARGMVTFRELIAAMYAQHGPDAITGIDYAQVNVDKGLVRASLRYLQRINEPLGHDVRCNQVDYQGYFLYEFWPAEQVPA